MTTSSQTFGSAQFATRRHLERAGLFANRGLVLGEWGGRYLRHARPEHVLMAAPTRSGKGVGFVIPTLLSWVGSAVICDIKGENWAATAGWRAKFSRCLKFDPTAHGSCRFNPLLEVRRGDNEVRDVQNIADMLVDPDGALRERSHWDKTAHAFLTGVLLHVLYAEREKTLARACHLISDPARPVNQLLQTMLTTPHLGDKGVHPVVASAARDLLNKAENERSGVVSTAVSFLTLYRDPLIAEATATSDFRIADLKGDKPVSLYLVVPPSDLSRMRPLLRLMLNQMLRCLTETWMPNIGAGQTLLLMLDEFPALGRLDFFESAMAFLAGYGVRACLIAQSLNQLDKAYGANHALIDNCGVRLLFAPHDERTAKRISEALGVSTQQRTLKSISGQRSGLWLTHESVSRQESARPLLTPGEILQLGPDDSLILTANCPPIKAKKLRYFSDRNFLERCLDPPLEFGRRSEGCDHDLTGFPVRDVKFPTTPSDDFVFDDGTTRSQTTPNAPKPANGVERDLDL